MNDLLAFIVRFELVLYFAFGVMTLVSLILFWMAYRRTDQALFGMERAVAQRRQNFALALVILTVGLVAAVFTVSRYVVPVLNAPALNLAADDGPTATPTPVPSATPILSGDRIVVDSSGCGGPGLKITKPESGENIAGAYEIRGTANLPNFAFYKVEISNASTSGTWVTVSVGREPKMDGSLGTFNTEPYPPGEYAFRLIVIDNMGRPSVPCVIVVSFGIVAPTATPTP